MYTAKPEHPIKISRLTNIPMNEYRENGDIFIALFPDKFMFGKIGNLIMKGTMADYYVKHLLLQRSNAFSSDARFLFTVFNQKLRHATARQVSLKVKNNANKMTEFSNLVSSKEFADKLNRAIAEPEGPEVKEILHQVEPIIQLIGKKLDYSAAQRSAAVTDIYAMMQCFGPPSVFYTVAPDDTHSVLAIRMSFPTTSTDSFPVVDGGLLEAKLNGDTSIAANGIEFDISEPGLKQLLSKNPVAAAQLYKLTVETIWIELLGIDPDYRSRATKHPCDRTKGIFGKVFGAYNSSECQARLSLHGHGLAWTYLRPDICQLAPYKEPILQAVKEVIASQIRAHLDPIYHLQAIGNLVTEPDKRPPQEEKPIFKVCPIPDGEEKENDYNHRLNLVMGTTCIHCHRIGTCRKGKFGARECRLAFSRRLTTNTDGPNPEVVQLVPRVDNDTQKTSYSILPNFNFDKSLYAHDKKQQPLHISSKECIVYSPYRPKVNMDEYNVLTDSSMMRTDDIGTHCMPPALPYSLAQIAKWREGIDYLPDRHRGIAEGVLENRNQAVVECSPTQAALMTCNTNLQLSGGSTQGIAQAFYTIKYVTKNPVEIAQVINVVKYARQKIEQYPSVADDTGTVLRTGQHFANVLLNKLTGMSELADTQAAACMIQMPAQFGSHKTTFIFMRPAIAYVRSKIGDRKSVWDEHCLHDEDIFEGSSDSGDSTYSPSDSQASNDNKYDSDTYYDSDSDSTVDNDHNSKVRSNLEADLISHQAVESMSVENCEPNKEGVDNKNNNIDDEFAEFLPIQSEGSYSWGNASIYKVNNIPTPVPQHINYFYRGEKLKRMSLMEYLCCIAIEEIPSTQRPKVEVKKSCCIGSLAEDECQVECDEEYDEECDRDCDEEYDETCDSQDETEDNGYTVEAIEDIIENTTSALNSSNRTDPNTQKKRRTPNARYLFDKNHPLYTTHRQTIRSKLYIPCLAGARPPTFKCLDGNKATKHKLNEAAEYFLVLMSPWNNDGVPEDGVSFSDFLRYTNKLYSNKHIFECRSKIGYIQSVSNSLYVDKTFKSILIKFRTSSVDKWNDKEITASKAVEYFNKYHKHKGHHISEYDQFEDAQEISESLVWEAGNVIDLLRKMAVEPGTNKNNKDNQRLTEYLNHTYDTFKGMLDESNIQSDLYNRLPSPDTTSDWQSSLNITSEYVTLAANINAKEVYSSLTSKDNIVNTLPKPARTDTAVSYFNKLYTTENLLHNRTRIKKFHLTVSQHAVLETLSLHLQEPKQQLFMLLHGGPGVGKTWTVIEFIRLCEVFGKNVLPCSATGAACSNIPGAVTIHTGFDIHPYTGKGGNNETLPKSNKLLRLSETIGACDYIIIDEISMCSAILFANIEQRLREATKSHLPFGGKHIIITGDFFQLDPVGNAPLYSTLLKVFKVVPERNRDKLSLYNKANKPLVTGANLFSKFKLYELKEQMRAADDPKQIQLIEDMRNLDNSQPITHELLQDLITNNTLNASDFTTSSGKSTDTYSKAVIVVTTNAERVPLNLLFSQSFAKHMLLPVIIFPLALFFLWRLKQIWRHEIKYS